MEHHLPYGITQCYLLPDTSKYTLPLPKQVQLFISMGNGCTLTAETAKTLVQAFIYCRLDYCNSLLFGVTDNVMRRVQSLQNATARLITGARHRDHITPVLRQLHWLPVRRRVRRVEFKLACLVHQALFGQMPTYLADDIRLVSEGN